MSTTELIALIVATLSGISALGINIATFINNRGKAPAEAKHTQADTASTITNAAGALILLLQKQITDMGTQVEAMQKEITELKSTVEQYRGELESRDDEIKELTIRIKILHENIEEKNKRIVTLENKIAELLSIQNKVKD